MQPDYLYFSNLCPESLTIFRSLAGLLACLAHPPSRPNRQWLKRMLFDESNGLQLREQLRIYTEFPLIAYKKVGKTKFRDENTDLSFGSTP